MTTTRWSALALMMVIAAGCDRGHEVRSVDFDAPDLGEELAALDEALDGVRIVLLGENGHGVREHTETKVRLIEWLHREHGFDLVLFESGMFECGHAYDELPVTESASVLRSCLRYAFEHAEVLPVFDLARSTLDTDRPLRFGGIDFQAQGFDSGPRPEASFEWLAGADSALAERVARADSALFLVPQAGGMGDSVYRYAYEHADSLKADYRRAASLTEGPARWVFLLAEGWVDRLAVRGRAEAEGADAIPGDYYELRDEWMARAVVAHADSIAPGARVIVWLHNDHARYGRFPAASGDSIRSTGGFLREWYGPEVLSLGLFLGRGTIADNARRPRTVVPAPADGIESYLNVGEESFVLLRDNADPDVRAWAGAPHPYLRMGLDTLALVPAREFDGLIYIDSVSVPTWELDRGGSG